MDYWVNGGAWHILVLLAPAGKTGVVVFHLSCILLLGAVDDAKFADPNRIEAVTVQ